MLGGSSRFANSRVGSILKGITPDPSPASTLNHRTTNGSRSATCRATSRRVNTNRDGSAAELMAWHVEQCCILLADLGDLPG